jgi:hypothetical protein|tara:strand:- start:597 stop:860 length:264 start_codon:yes stop_codon:yes gene_type:complete
MSGSAIAVVRGLGSVDKAVSISDTTTQSKPKGVYIGTSGDYYFEMNGTAVLFSNTAEGSILPIRPTKVATNSGLSSAVSAGNILFLY